MIALVFGQRSDQSTRKSTRPHRNHNEMFLAGWSKFKAKWSNLSAILVPFPCVEIINTDALAVTRQLLYTIHRQCGGPGQFTEDAHRTGPNAKAGPGQEATLHSDRWPTDVGVVFGGGVHFLAALWLATPSMAARIASWSPRYRPDMGANACRPSYLPVTCLSVSLHNHFYRRRYPPFCSPTPFLLRYIYSSHAGEAGVPGRA
jgi:hypothetical protein